MADRIDLLAHHIGPASGYRRLDPPPRPMRWLIYACAAVLAADFLWMMVT